jgi:pimeloyl-ACP methyl ester carboxylesterase
MVETKGPVRNVHYLELGQGKPLILIHGGGSYSSEWFNILNALSNHYHLYVVDRPGCGLTDFINYRDLDFEKSAIDFVKTFMDAVGLKRAMFLGQSMGGYFSIAFALKFPERVDTLGLIGAPAGLNNYIPFMLRLMGTRGINKLMGTPDLPTVKMLYKKLLVADVSSLPEDYLRHTYYHMQLPGTVRSFQSLLENVLSLKGWKKKYYLGDQLNQLQVPVRFIWGSKDAFEKPETGKQKAATIPDHQFEVVENAGHCPWLDQPEKCVALISSMIGV